MTLWIHTAQLNAEVEAHNKLYHADVENIPMRVTKEGKLVCKLCPQWQSHNRMDLSPRNLLSDKEINEIVGDL